MVVMNNTLNIALTGLESATRRVTASASNIANVTTAGSLQNNENAPYTPLTTSSSTLENGGVSTRIVERTSDRFTPVYSPDSPFADDQGIIGVPNVNLTEEAVNLTIAETQYRASAQIIETTAELSDELLSIFDEEA